MILRALPRHATLRTPGLRLRGLPGAGQGFAGTPATWLRPSRPGVPGSGRRARAGAFAAARAKARESARRASRSAGGLALVAVRPAPGAGEATAGTRQGIVPVSACAVAGPSSRVESCPAAPASTRRADGARGAIGALRGSDAGEISRPGRARAVRRRLAGSQVALASRYRDRRPSAAFGSIRHSGGRMRARDNGRQAFGRCKGIQCRQALAALPVVAGRAAKARVRQSTGRGALGMSEYLRWATRAGRETTDNGGEPMEQGCQWPDGCNRGAFRRGLEQPQGGEPGRGLVCLWSEADSGPAHVRSMPVAEHCRPEPRQGLQRQDGGVRHRATTCERSPAGFHGGVPRGVPAGATPGAASLLASRGVGCPVAGPGLRRRGRAVGRALRHGASELGAGWPARNPRDTGVRAAVRYPERVSVCTCRRTGSKPSTALLGR